MQAEALLSDGDLAATLAALQSEIRSKPQDAKLRIFLFQLLAVLGDWNRAVQQLKISAELDPAAVPMAQTYREGIVSEVFREKVFAGEKEPLFLGEPEPWMPRMVQALQALARGEVEAAAQQRAGAYDEAAPATGTLNGERFEWIADADSRLGPLLEIIVNGKYFWVPFTLIGTLKIEPPEDLRDRVWTPATVKWANAGEVVALIPTRYPGLANFSDTEKLARTTDWADLGHDTFAGRGQRVLATDKADIALMDVRELVIDQADG